MANMKPNFTSIMTLHLLNVTHHGRTLYKFRTLRQQNISRSLDIRYPGIAATLVFNPRSGGQIPLNNIKCACQTPKLGQEATTRQHSPPYYFPTDSPPALIARSITPLPSLFTILCTLSRETASACTDISLSPSRRTAFFQCLLMLKDASKQHILHSVQ